MEKKMVREFIALFSSVMDAIYLFEGMYNSGGNEDTKQVLLDRLANSYSRTYDYYINQNILALSDEISASLFNAENNDLRIRLVKDILRSFADVVRFLNPNENDPHDKGCAKRHLALCFEAWRSNDTGSKYFSTESVELQYLLLCKRLFREFSLELDKICLTLDIDLIKDVQTPLDLFMFRERDAAHIGSLALEKYGDLFGVIGYEVINDDQLNLNSIRKIAHSETRPEQEPGVPEDQQTDEREQDPAYSENLLGIFNNDKKILHKFLSRTESLKGVAVFIEAKALIDLEKIAKANSQTPLWTELSKIRDVKSLSNWNSHFCVKLERRRPNIQRQYHDAKEAYK